MRKIFELGISDNTISEMLERCPNIKELTDNEIDEKIFILKHLGCSDNQISNIISSNPNYLDRTNEDIFKLISKLNSLGFNCLNILFDSNPYILDLDPFEIDNYINERINNGELLDDIIDDLDSNPYLFSEM